MKPLIEHISVCICTYKRPSLLENLLIGLQSQYTDNLFSYSIVVVDNDINETARNIVDNYKRKTIIAISYFNEAEKNISLARNKAVKNATGKYIAFIDDDEYPDNTWLLNLYKTLKKYNSDGVLGPVKPQFEIRPPSWVTKGKLCERTSFKTGTILNNSIHTRTGNVLLCKDIFDEETNLFDVSYGKTGGEDVNFFRHMIQKDFSFVWCDDAVVYEIVPLTRCKRSYFLKRALMRGAVNSNNISFFSFEILKSLTAFILYTIALPFLLLTCRHIFMKYLIKDCDHIGKLFGTCGIKIIKEKNF